MVELKRKLVLLQEDNRRLESQIDQQKVMQIESDREKLQIEAKLREAEFKQEAIQVRYWIELKRKNILSSEK